MSNTRGASSSSKVTAGAGSSVSSTAISPEQFALVKTTLLDRASTLYGDTYGQAVANRLDTDPDASLAIFREVLAERGHPAGYLLTDGSDTQTGAAASSADLAQSSWNADNLSDAMQGYSQHLLPHPLHCLQLLGGASLESAREWFGYCTCPPCSAVEASLTSTIQGDLGHIAH